MADGTQNGSQRAINVAEQDADALNTMVDAVGLGFMDVREAFDTAYKLGWMSGSLHGMEQAMPSLGRVG